MAILAVHLVGSPAIGHCGKDGLVTPEGYF